MKNAMADWIERFPDMLEEAWTHVPAGAPVRASRLLVVGGMGGSVMAGTLAAGALAGDGRILIPWSQPALPAYYSNDEDGLLLVSYSGNTWETVALFDEARARGVLPGVVTSGGMILARALQCGCAVGRVPGGMAPRAALPWLLTGVLRAAGFDDGSLVLSAAEAVRAEAASPIPERDPRRLADRMRGRLIVLVPVGAVLDAVAIRWRNQILENAEQTAFVSPLPEMAHNEIMGWGWMREAGVPVTIAVLLPGPPADSAVWDGLVSGLREEAERHGHDLLVVPPPPVRAGLPAILAQVYLGDRLSLLLAESRGVDPVAIEAIGRLKRAAGKERLS